MYSKKSEAIKLNTTTYPKNRGRENQIKESLHRKSPQIFLKNEKDRNSQNVSKTFYKEKGIKKRKTKNYENILFRSESQNKTKNILNESNFENHQIINHFNDLVKKSRKLNLEYNLFKQKKNERIRKSNYRRENIS